MKVPALPESKLTTASLALAVFFSCFAVSASAGEASGQFQVTATLLTANTPARPATAFCARITRSNGFGATLTAGCTTGTIANQSANPWMNAYADGSAYRYLYQISAGGQLMGTIDGYTDLGNEISWREIVLMDRKYLEMRVGW